MKKALCFFTSLAILNGLSLFAANPSRLIFEDSWAGFREGPLTDAYPWQLTSLNRGFVEITSRRSPFGKSTQSIRIVHEDDSSSGPRIQRMFPAPVAGPIEVAFDFFLEAPSNDQPTFFLLGTPESSLPDLAPGGLNLSLQNNSFPNSLPGKNIINRQAGPNGDLISPVELGQWYHVRLKIAAPAEGKYDIIVTTEGSGNAPVEVKGLPFRHAMIDYTGVRFMTNTNHGSGALTLANFSVRHGGNEE